MGIEMIGRQIAALRKEQGCKQEEVARAVGVSSQAVSKWENGGVPDTELLPAIADFFGVSIDFLFKGPAEKHSSDLNYALMKRINEAPESERIKLILSYCFYMEQATMIPSNSKDVLNIEEYEKKLKPKEQCYSSVMYDNGFTLMGVANRSQYFLVVPDAESSDSAYFEGVDYLEFFKDFSDKSLFEACIFFHKRNQGISRKAFTSSMLVKNLDITEEKALEIINTLEKYSMITRTQIELDDEMQTVYNFVPTPSFVALLIFAHEIIKKPNFFSFFCNNRKTPYLK